MKKIILFFLPFLFLTNNANAKNDTLSNSLFLELQNSKGEEYKKHLEHAIKPYILGSADSLMTANAYLKMNGQKEIFCQPGDLGLNINNYIRFALEQIEEDKKNERYNGEQPLSITLLFRLIKIFPCK